ncbi:MAG: acyl carrier protein [Bacteroidetes bacterium]|nr:acyl carrier protein [Bacteroidota bacterium]
MKEKILNILNGLRPEYDFRESANFIDEGMLDSLDVVNLVTDLEDAYGILIDGVDILPNNFSSVDSIINLLIKNGAKA